jgi:hypothetical protein
VAAVGGEDQILLEIAPGIAQEGDNPGIIGEHVDERVMVGRSKLV